MNRKVSFTSHFFFILPIFRRPSKKEKKIKSIKYSFKTRVGKNEIYIPSYKYVESFFYR